MQTDSCTTTGISFANQFQVTSLRKEVVDEATKAIAEEFGEDVAKRFIWLQCDLSDWSQTAKVATEIAEKTDRIDILINNAARGIMTRQLAETNGIDAHMATNQYVGSCYIPPCGNNDS